MEPTQDLRRELGFWDALTIGAGTMIGAGIFLLAGVAIEMAGPAAILSYLFAGLVCVATAASAAELATGMPTSGGDYYFVSRSLGPALGAISGVGIWLSLTVAISFYLFGMGTYLALFTPLPPVAGAAVGGILLTALNVTGAKESGRTQVVVVLMLVAILAVFSVLGAFDMKAANLTPFAPFGTDPILATTAVVFVSFLGFVKIAAVAEEIEDPSRNLPRTLIGSVVFVTLLYVLIVVVIGGIFPQPIIGAVRDPLTSAARELLGSPGAAAIIFAGLLATISSANASILASSRINLAMSRDRMFPNWLARIHRKLLTPYRAILLTGILALAFLALDDLGELAKIASSLQLYSYAALNVGCIVLRVAAPDWYRPTFRTPGFPVVQVLAAASCIGIIFYSGPFAQIAVGILIVFSLAFYAVWGRTRVSIDHALPDLRARLAEHGLRVVFAPPTRFEAPAPAPAEVSPRAVEPTRPLRVMVALANPDHETDLLRMGRWIATGREEGGEVFGVHFARVPLQTPLTTARDEFDRQGELERRIVEYAKSRDGERPRRPLEDTRVEAVTDVAHDVFEGLIGEANARADLLLMGWRGGFNVSRIYNSPVQRVMRAVDTDTAVLKNRGVSELTSILLPWGGGLHAHLALEVAVRIAGTTGAHVRLLRITRPGADVREEQDRLADVVREIVEEREWLHYTLREADGVAEGIQAELEDVGHDLVVIGASRESPIRSVLFGSIPDIVADSAPCSVLMVHRNHPEARTVGAENIEELRRSLGLGELEGDGAPV